MTADSYSLLDLILKLLSDGEEAEKFAEDPHRYLEGKGLDGICVDDVKDLKALVLDYDTNVKAAFGDTTFDLGNKGNAYGGDAGGAGGGRDGGHHRPDHDDDHRGGHHDGDDDNEKDAVIKEITNILNNYTYTTIDDRDTAFDQSVKQNIFAKGDVKQSFDYDTTVASGDGAVAAGGDVYGAATGDGAIAAGGDIDGDAVSGDGNVTGNGNTLVGGDGNIVGDENEVGNTDVEINDSFQDNSDNSVEVEDSFNKEVEVEDSFNKEVDIEESFNKEKTEVEIEDVAVAVDHAIAATDNELEVSA